MLLQYFIIKYDVHIPST